MKFTIRTLIWIFIILAFLLAGYLVTIPKPVEVETAAVIEGPLLVSVREDGKTRIREKYIVSAPVSGRLSRIQLHEGDEISGEDNLVAVILPSEPAILDARTQAEAVARVQAAQASLNRAEAQSGQRIIQNELTKSKFERQKRLLSNNAVSNDDYDVARTEFLATAQAIKTAKFETEIAQFELEMARAAAKQFSEKTDEAKTEPFEIYSPVTGKVLRVFQESSTVVNVGTPLIEIGDPRKLELEIDVLSTDATQIRPGSEVLIEHWGGKQPLSGHVRVIEPAAFTKVSSLGVEEQRVNIIADFTDDKTAADRLATLGDGYRVEARITIEELKGALIVPNSALFRYQRQWHVLTVAENRADMRLVEIGLQNETHSQILSGLNQGESVIVYPSDEIESGTVVKPMAPSE
jgi:HlyD family secretion protein